jgi:hypothetical protein
VWAGESPLGDRWSSLRLGYSGLVEQPAEKASLNRLMGDFAGFEAMPAVFVEYPSAEGLIDAIAPVVQANDDPPTTLGLQYRYFTHRYTQ